MAGSEIVVHPESGDDVVIIEGTVGKLTEGSADPDRLERLDSAYEESVRHGTPFWVFTCGRSSRGATTRPTAYRSSNP